MSAILPVKQIDRDIGWPVRHEAYATTPKAHWDSGVYDGCRLLQALAAQRVAATAQAMRNASILTQQMCGTIGALEGSSIFAALHACWERMDEIADEHVALRAATQATP